ncbi:hypothetical protein ACFVOR_37525 [Streptomyces sp. NPDC057837]|uniref:hypothetical protein n=1 Tax=Streptomyces sp. NPDC057837 TaxID=3346260 RepID=UPI00369337AF
MTTTPDTTPAADAQDDGFEVMQADAVFTGRNMGAGAHIAGILTAAQAATAPTPKALLRDLWPDVDPAAVAAIYERGVEVGWRGRQLYEAPRLHGEELAKVQGQLEEAGFLAMPGLLARSRELRARGRHPADGEIAREH